LLYQSRLEIPRELAAEFHVEHKVRPSSEVHADHRERLIHRDARRAVPPYGFLSSQRLPQRLPENDPDIFHRVVRTHRKGALRPDLQVQKAMFREQRQHVVDKTDACIGNAPSAAVQVQLQPYVGFRSLPAKFGFPGHPSTPVYVSHSPAPGRTFRSVSFVPVPAVRAFASPAGHPLQPVSWDVRAPEYPVQHLDEGPHFFVGADGNTQMIVYQGLFEIPDEYAVLLQP